jgi:AraC-like DNA-binding protein
MFALMLFSAGFRGVKSNRILGFYMTITSFQFLFSLIDNFGISQFASIGYYVLMPLMLINTPLLYYYVVYLTTPKTINKPQFLLHFLPTLIVLIINIVTYGLLSDDLKLTIISRQKLPLIADSQLLLFDIYKTTYHICSVYIYNTQVVVYGILMLIKYNQHRKTIKSYFSYTEKISLKWILIFILLFWGISIYEIFLYDIYRDFYFYLLFFYIGFLGYFGFKQHDIYIQEILEERNNNLSAIESKVNIKADLVPEFETISLKNTIEKTEKINPVIINENIEKLEQIMLNEKPYLNSNLNISELAELIGVHRNTLSMLINDYYNKNFFTFINEYRIEEAKNKLSDRNFDQFSIEGIAKSVGFNSKSVFNPAFRNITGLTPAEYKKQNTK